MEAAGALAFFSPSSVSRFIEAAPTGGCNSVISQSPAPHTSPLSRCCAVSYMSCSFHNPHEETSELWQHPQSCLHPLPSHSPPVDPNTLQVAVCCSPVLSQAVLVRCLCFPMQPPHADPLPSPGSQPTPICSPCTIEKPALPLPNKHLGFKIQLACVISERSPRRAEMQPASPSLLLKAELPLPCPKTSA